MKLKIKNHLGDVNLQKNKVQKIPYNIFQTFKYRDVPVSMYENCNKWIKLNPEYNYYFYDDKEMFEYVNKSHFKGFAYNKQVFLKAFNKIKPGAGKADLFRLLIIYEKGGCYFDFDTTCLKPLRKLIKENDEVVTGIGSYKDWFIQWGLIYVKNHPFIKKALEIAIYNIIKEKFIYNMPRLQFLCGPPCLDLAIRRILNVDRYYKFEPKNYVINNIKFTIIPRAQNFNKCVGFKYSAYKFDLKKLNMNHWGYEDIFNK